MHVYSINSSKRETVIKITLVITVFIMLAITPRFLELKEKIYKHLLKDANTASYQRLVIECLLTFIPSLTIYGLLRWIFNKVVWKWKPVIYWHQIPDFSGNWNMILTSAMKDRPRQIKVTVKQDWNKISVVTKSSSGTKVVSNAAAIETDGSNVRLRYAYIVHKDFCSYEGFNTLVYDKNDNKLEGTYCSGKTFPENDLAALCGQAVNSECVRKLCEGTGSKGKMVWTRQ